MSSYFWSDVLRTGIAGELWVSMRIVLPATPSDKHIHPRIFLPGHESSYPIFLALMGRRKPLNCSDLQQIMKNPRDLSEPPLLRNQNKPRPPATGLRPFANRDLTFWLSPWGASPEYRMLLVEAVIFSSLWACELLPITSVYKRGCRDSLLLALYISFVHGNLFFIHLFFLQLALGS